MTLVRWGFFAVAAVALWNTLRHAELGRAASLALAVGAPVVLVALPHLVAMSLQATAYRRILGLLRAGPPPSFFRLLSVLLSTEAVLLALPGGQAIAETLNPYLLLRRCGVPVPEGLAAVATKKSLIVFANAVYIGIAVILGAGYLEAASPALIGRPGLPWLVAGSGVALFLASVSLGRVLLSGSVASRSHGLLRRIPSARFRAFLDARKAGFAAIDGHFSELLRAGVPALASAAALMLGCWLVEGGEAWIILRLLGVRITYVEVLAIEVVVSFLRSLTFMVPAGLGVLDAGYVAFLGAFGVPDAPTLGVAFVLVKRTKEVLWIAVGFSLFLLLGDAPSKLEEAVPAG
jgi:hypothetical protein